MRLYSLLTFALTGLCAFALYTIIANAPATLATVPWLDIWLEVALVALVGTILLIFALPLSDARRFDLAVGAVSLFLTATLALVLKNTPFTVGAVTGDQRFYTYFVTKFAAYPGYVDGVYRDLPTFYPPLYYYVLGRLAALFHVEPFHMMKIGLLVTTFVLPYAGAWLWRRLVDDKIASAAAFALLFYQVWFKPAEWLTLVLFVPWWLSWVEDVGQRRPVQWRAQLRWWLIGGLLGGLIFQTYYYWFFIGGVSLVISLVARQLRLVQTDDWRIDLRHAAGMLAGAALFSSIYWGPYLYSMYATGGWEPLQNRWLSEGKIPLPLPFVDDSLEGVFLLGGLLYLVLSASHNRVSRGLLSLVMAVYVWAALGYVGMLTDHPLLTFRAYPVIDYLLTLGAIIGLLRLWHTVDWSQFLRSSTLALHRLAPALLLVLLIFFGQESTRRLREDENVQKALAAQVPNAPLAALDTLTGQQYRGKDFLLGDAYVDLMAFRPFYSFLPWTATFSHPAGRLHERARFLEQLATTADPALFAAAFMHNRYSRLDYVLLEPSADDWLLAFTDIDFPNRTFKRALQFDGQLLAEPYFQRRDEAGLTLFTPVYANDPLNTVPAQGLAGAPFTTTVLAYALTGAFMPHLDLPNGATLRTEAEQLLTQADMTMLPVATLLDLHQAAEGALAASIRTALLEKLTPLDLPLLDASGTEKLHVLGYSVEPPAAGAKAELAIYFEVVSPLDQAYTLWLHAYQEGAQNNFDHTPNVATSAWRSGKIYRDVTLLDVAPGEYNLSFGLWRSEEDVRLVQQSGDVGVDLGLHQLR